jgi:SAM-dependent methyltransferase
LIPADKTGPAETVMPKTGDGPDSRSVSPSATIPREDASGKVQREAGSFRDPGGTVFSRDGRIFRAIHPRSMKDWNEFSASPLCQELQRERLLVRTWPVERREAQPPAGVAEGGAVIEHERIPFVSYPYEWSFGMLRDAALLHLDILEKCLSRDFIVKDASAYNVQFVGCRPVFIDALSFVRLRPGEPWAGYNQFCKMFLYPLMLRAYKRVPFQSWLRGELEGLDPAVFSRLFGVRDFLRPGVFTHVFLQAWMQKRMEASQTNVRGKIQSAGFSKAAIAHNLAGLRRLVMKLQARDDESHWVEYTRGHSYSPEALEKKEEFVRRALERQRPRLLWDLGSNTGHFSRIAGQYATQVVAFDADVDSVNRFYASLKEERKENILPLVANLANLSPDQGWGGRERRSLPGRGKPDFVLCLALIHHLAISCNIPVESLVGWLAELGSSLIIEFVEREDPMVKKLLLNKDDTYDEYNRPAFEACLKRHFQVQDSFALPGGSRVLYFATPVPAGS